MGGLVRGRSAAAAIGAAIGAAVRARAARTPPSRGHGRTSARACALAAGVGSHEIAATSAHGAWRTTQRPRRRPLALWCEPATFAGSRGRTKPRRRRTAQTKPGRVQEARLHMHGTINCLRMQIARSQTRMRAPAPRAPPLRLACGRFAPRMAQAAPGAASTMPGPPHSPQYPQIRHKKTHFALPHTWLRTRRSRRAAASCATARKSALASGRAVARSSGNLLHEKADPGKADRLIVVPGAGHARGVAGQRHPTQVLRHVLR